MLEVETKENYLTSVSEQIRCKKAVPPLLSELENHIDDQIESYMEEGMEQEDAEKQAVREMGDPVEVGLELDAIHRPHNNWKVILVFGLFCTVGLLLQYIIITVLKQEHENMWWSIGFTVAGFLFMIGIHYVDFSVLHRHFGWMYAGYYLLAWWILYKTRIIHSASHQEADGKIVRRITSISYANMVCYAVAILSIPILAAVLFQLKQFRMRELILIFISMIPTIGICYSCKMLLETIEIFMIEMAMVGFWMYKYNQRLKISRYVIMGFMALIPLGVFLIVKMQWIPGYMIGHYGNYLGMNEFLYDETKYMPGDILQLIGMKGTLKDTSMIPSYNSVDYTMSSSYLLTASISILGTVAGFGIIAALTVLLIRLIQYSKRVSGSLLGNTITFGCILLFLVETVQFMLVNLSAVSLPSQTQLYCMFLSTGQIITTSHLILLGWMLSVFRYRDVINDAWLRRKRN